MLFRQNKINLPKFGVSKFTFLSLSTEALIAGFYVAVTRSITPIFLVANGYRLEDISLINVFAGLFSLLLGLLLYKHGSKAISKPRLLITHTMERILWFTIPFMLDNKLLLTLVYGLAVASTLPTSIYMQTTILTSFNGVSYRRIVGVRSALGAFSSILGHAYVVSTLAMRANGSKYLNLYETAFVIGMLSSIVVALTPANIFRNGKTMIRNGSLYAEAKATNTFILLVTVISSYMLLNMAWTPRIMNDLEAPDYMAASIGFVQTVASIGSSFFWINRNTKTYRAALVLLAFMPLLVSFTFQPELHILLALIYGFSVVGVNMFAARIYSDLIGEIGVFRTGTLLASMNSLALTLASIVGFMVSASPSMVFLVSALLGTVGLIIALTGFPELAIIPENYVQLYSRIMYQTGISSYNLAIYAMSESAKATLRIVSLSLMLMLLFIIYRTIYYIMVITGR